MVHHPGSGELTNGGTLLLELDCRGLISSSAFPMMPLPSSQGHT